MGQPDARPFEPGSTVRVLADDAALRDGRVPVGTIATVIDSEESKVCTRIKFEHHGVIEATTWLWNYELELVIGSRVSQT